MPEEKNTFFIQFQIDCLNDKIKTYEEAKTAVRDVKNPCDSKIQAWQSSYNKLANNLSLAKVEKKKEFEGKMAKSLKSKVSDVIEDISTGLSAADSLSGVLSKQVTNIETKIEQLKNERRSWQNQL